MSCQQLRGEFVPFLLGELEPHSVRVIEGHLADGCAACINEFEALRESVDLAFNSVPAATVTIEQQHRILRLAQRRAVPTASDQKFTANNFTAQKFTRSSSPEIQSLSHGALTLGRLLQALLAVAAGFSLVVGWQALQTNLRTSGQPADVRQSGTAYNAAAIGKASEALSGDPQMLPRAHDVVHFVSFKVQPTQPALAGYFLADPFSGELHVVGSIAAAPQPFEKFQLTLMTDQTAIDVPISVDPTGRFQVIVPLPPHAIRDVVLTALGVSS